MGGVGSVPPPSPLPPTQAHLRLLHEGLLPPAHLLSQQLQRGPVLGGPRGAGLGRLWEGPDVGARPAGDARGRGCSLSRSYPGQGRAAGVFGAQGQKLLSGSQQGPQLLPEVLVLPFLGGKEMGGGGTGSRSLLPGRPLVRASAAGERPAALLTRLWFSCCSCRKGGSADPSGSGGALGGAPPPGGHGHGQDLGSELGIPPCLGVPCCRGQPHPRPASEPAWLGPATGSRRALGWGGSPSSLERKILGTSPPTRDPETPAGGTGKGLAASMEWAEGRDIRQGHLTNPWQGCSRHPPWLLEAGVGGHWGWEWPQEPRVFGPSIPPCDPFLTPAPGSGLAHLPPSY